MQEYSVKGSSSTKALLEEVPTIATSATDENSRQPQTRFNPLQWWWPWRQRQQEEQHTDGMPASDPPRSDHTPTTVEQATEALMEATKCAGFTAQCGAYGTKCRGYKADVAFAEASAAIALATATAAYAVADTKEDRYLFENIRTDHRTMYANTTMMGAEAAYAAAQAISTMPLSRTSIGNLFFWRRSPLSTHLHASMDTTIDAIVTAATTSAAAAQSAIEATLTTNTTTTRTETGVQIPYDPEDAARLYIAGRLAQASASAASAAASAIRATHPALATRAACAAGTAIAASSNATITRLRLLESFSKVRNPLTPDYYGDKLRKWLKTLKTFRSPTAEFELGVCIDAVLSFVGCPMQEAEFSSKFGLLQILSSIKLGILAVTTDGSACASDISDESSSVTVCASSPGADDES